MMLRSDHESTIDACRRRRSASGFVKLVTPTSAVIMGGLALSNIRHNRYLTFVWPFLILVFVVCCPFVGIAAAVE
jgi:uncharacterized ion transporter superfamily protein YfcC